MPTVLLLQTSRWRDAADDAALVATAHELHPTTVIAAAANPHRTARVTGIRTVAADPTTVIRGLSGADLVVVLGGRPLASHARTDHLHGLTELAAITGAIRAAGKRYALVGVGAGPVTSRRDAFCVRHVVGNSALTVLDDVSSVQHLTDVGVPHPLRVGADLAWLQLQEPPRIVPGGDELWCTATRDEVEAVGGASVFAELVAMVLHSLHRVTGETLAVTIQAWHCGSGAGDDLDAAAGVADLLHDQGHRIRVAPPPSSMARERDVLRSTRFVLSGHPHALMTAAAAGVPMLAWPYERTGIALAARLGLPVLAPQVSGAGAGPEPLDQVVEAALAAGGQSLPAVRENVADAGEVVELLQMLITQGEPSVRAHPPRPQPVAGLRPTGVMR